MKCPNCVDGSIYGDAGVVAVCDLCQGNCEVTTEEVASWQIANGRKPHGMLIDESGRATWWDFTGEMDEQIA